MVPTRYLALVALLIAVPVSSWFIAYKPMNIAVQSTATEIRVRTNQLTNLSKINDQHRELRELSKALTKVATQTISRIPKDTDAEQWLESVSDAAKLLGLVVSSVTTSGEREVSGYKILPIDMSMKGSYSNVYQLIQHFERMERIARIDRMTIQRIDDDQVTARLVIHLVFGARNDT